MKKRIFAMLLALTMIIGILPMSVFAEASNWDPWDYTVDDVAGENAGSKTFPLQQLLHRATANSE